MKIIRRSIYCFIGFVFLFYCNRQPAFTVAIDLLANDQWIYSLSYRQSGNYRWNEAKEQLFNTISCELACTIEESQENVSVIARNSKISSNILDKSEVEHIHQTFSDVAIQLPLINGVPQFSDTGISSLSDLRQRGWYRQFVKLLPQLPNKPIRPGATWDRDRQWSFQTPQGDVTGTLYQSFVFDSVSRNDDDLLATIGWQFRHSLRPSDSGVTTSLQGLPLYGTGKGVAIINLEKKYLVRAEIQFSTPETPLPGFSLVWEEKAALELLETIESGEVKL